MQITGNLTAFRDAAPEDLAMLGLFHALQALSVALIDDDERRRKLEAVLEVLVDRVMQSDLSDEQLDHYLLALHAVTGQGNSA